MTEILSLHGMMFVGTWTIIPRAIDPANIFPQPKILQQIVYALTQQFHRIAAEFGVISLKGCPGTILMNGC
jgi:hypothetical protein